MNPENQLNQQKPNFERIAEIIIQEWASSKKEVHDSVINTWVEKFQKDWEKIEKGKISYPLNPHLEELLKEYHLKDFLPDFRYMGFMFPNWVKFPEEMKKIQIQRKGFPMELLQVLKLFHDSPSGITINFIRKQKIQAKIQNAELVKVINSLLFEYWKENDFPFQVGKIYPEDISDWGKYFNSRLSEEKAKTSKKGRKTGNIQFKRIIYCLWKYLQEYTRIKAEEGAGYSNEQARFISKFLEIHGLIENADLQSRKEDNIAHYLKAYKKRIDIN